MLVLLSFILIISFGYLFLSLIIKDLPLLERFGLSYLLGVGLITQLMFITSWMGIKITLISVLTMLSILIVFLLLINKLMKREIGIKFPYIRKLFSSLKWYEKIIVLIIVSVIFLSLVITLYYPVNVWDALALYDFVAKVIAKAGFFVQIASQYYYFAQYPLLVSLTHVIVYLSGGSNPQFTYSLYFLSFAIIFYSLVRRISTRFVALLATLLIVINPTLFDHSTIAYTNLPYTIFYVTGIIYLYMAVIHDKYDYLLISAILIGLSTWARALEPLWIVEVMAVIIYSAYKKSLYPLLIFILPFLALRQPWNVVELKLYGDFYSTTAQFASIGTIFTAGIDFRRVLDVTVYIYKNMILPWGPIFVFFLIAVFFDIKNRVNKRNLIMFILVFANFAAMSVGTYFFSIKYQDWRDVAGSAIRLSMFFIPLMIYSICLISENAVSRRR